MDKKDLRKYYKQVRRNIPETTKKNESKKIVQKFLNIFFEDNYDGVLLYAPLPDEADIFPVLEKVSGKTDVCFPRVNGETMDFYKVSDKSNLFKGNFDVFEPSDECEAIVLDSAKKYLIALPGIVFDREGYRIGYGKGYYDKYLFAHKNIDFYKVGICFNECLCDSLMPDEYDQKADVVLTAD